jgi:hypothetical protein
MSLRLNSRRDHLASATGYKAAAGVRGENRTGTRFQSQTGLSRSDGRPSAKIGAQSHASLEAAIRESHASLEAAIRASHAAHDTAPQPGWVVSYATSNLDEIARREIDPFPGDLAKLLE